MALLRTTTLSSASKIPWTSSALSRITCYTGRARQGQARHISIQQLDQQREGRERIVVIGSGWGGYGLLRQLDPRKYQTVVVSPRSYFVFTPLLAGASVGTLEFRTTIEPIRARGRATYGRAQFYQGWAEAVDLDKKVLSIEEAVEDPLSSQALVAADPKQELSKKNGSKEKGKIFDISWDKLVITVGCYSQTFNTKGVRENAYFLKDVGDARRIRNRILSCFEAASLPTTPPELKKALLNFAVVGGGPTGIEWAAEMHDLIAEDLKRLYPDLYSLAKITVYDVAEKVLSMFDEKLGKYAMKSFQRQGIEIKTSHHVQELRRGVPEKLKDVVDKADADMCYTLKLQEEGEVGVGMCVWSTGLMMNPFVEKLADTVKHDPKSAAILTDDRLRVKHQDDTVYKDVFALGDCAVLEGTKYPATAQVASQKAGWLAKRLNRGDLDTKGFTYKDLGVMAYTGAGSAILQSKGGDISGFAAWLIWRGVYLTKSVSWRNKILIPIYWCVYLTVYACLLTASRSINWLFGRDISRF